VPGTIPRTVGRDDDRLLRVLAYEAARRLLRADADGHRPTPLVSCATLFAPARVDLLGARPNPADRDGFLEAMNGTFLRLRPTGWFFPNDDDPGTVDAAGFTAGELPPGWRLEAGGLWSAHERLEAMGLVEELILPFVPKRSGRGGRGRKKV